MYTNISQGELKKYLKLVLNYRDDLTYLRPKKPRYFHRASQPAAPLHDWLGLYKYAPLPTHVDSFDFDAKQVFNWFAHHIDAWDQFHEDGTINIDGVFDYILEPEMSALIEEEFKMYRYHLRGELDG